MDTPSITLIESTSKVKDARSVINVNETVLAAAIGIRAGAFTAVNLYADLVTLLDATPLDFAVLADETVYVLKGIDPTNITNWMQIPDAVIVNNAIATTLTTATGSAAALALVFGA